MVRIVDRHASVGSVLKKMAVGNPAASYVSKKGGFDSQSDSQTGGLGRKRGFAADTECSVFLQGPTGRHWVDGVLSFS